MINSFLKSKIAKIKTSDKRYRSFVVREAYMMNKFGVKDEKSLLRFHYASQYVPIFVKYVCGRYDKKLMSDVFAYVMANSENIECSDDIKDIIARYFSKSKFVKTAYPNYGDDLQPIKKYDMNKWKTALNDITIRTRLYGDRGTATDYVIKDWSSMDEKRDFKNWAKEQEQGIGKLYRIALFGEMSTELQHIPGLTGKPSHPEPPKGKPEKTRDEITKQKVLGRINSIKKILSTKDGPHLLGNSYSTIMKAILDLEGDILGIRTASMIEDVIYRTANYLKEQDCDDVIVSSLNKIAQMPSLDSMPAELGMGGEPPMPGPGGEEGGENGGSAEEGKKALDTFIEKIRGYPTNEMTPDSIEERFDKIVDEFKGEKSASWYNYETEELRELERVAGEIFSVVKLIKFANRNEEKKIAFSDVVELVKSAQEAALDAPPEPIEPALDAPPEPAPELEDEPEKPKGIEDKGKEDVDRLFADVKVSDVITRLEALSRVFQNREIARQLGIIDLMLDSLGLAGFFPSLAEATRSALESNQYCQTRVEEILSRLISSVDETGEAIIDVEKEDKKPGNIIDKEMEEYLSEEVPAVEGKPKPVREKAEVEAIPEPKPEAAPEVVPEPAAPAAPPEREVPITPAV